MNKMSGESHQQVLVSATAFPILTLKPPVSISNLWTFAEEVLGMIISHKSLHEVTRLLKCIPMSSRELLRMLLNSQGVKDTNLVECQYPDTYKKGGKDFPFPNI